MKIADAIANKVPHTFLTPRLGTQILCVLGLAISLPISLNDFARPFALALAAICIIGLIRYPPIVAFRLAFEIFYRRFVALLGEHYRDEVEAYKWRSSLVHDIVKRRAIKGGDSLTSLIESKDWDSLNLRWVLNYARLLSLQPLKDEDLETASYIYKSLHMEFGDKVFKQRFSPMDFSHARVYLDLLFTLERYEDWHELARNLPNFSIPAKTTEIDLLHPSFKDGLDPSPWLSAFNREFIANGLEPISVEDPLAPSIDRIICDPQSLVPSGELITVIMSAFNSGPEIISAVKSVLNQSWENFELIIVDDCSTETDYIEKASLLDKRIKLIRHSENSGTYVARNSAMAIASGTFITTHDSDDWVHPRRLELQANSLIQNPDLKANLSRAIRTSPNLALSRLGFTPSRLNASSLMFKREIIDEIGGFDPVRKGADSEYAARIAAAYSGGLQLIGFAPLAIIRMGHSSLSRSEFSAKWAHPARQMYRSAYRRWHEQHRYDFAKLRPAERRNFVAPRRFLGAPELADQANNFDFLIATDISISELLNRDLQIVRAMQLENLTVGILNLAPVGMQIHTPDELQDALNSGLIAGICADDSVSAKNLLITAPNAARIFDPETWKIAANRTFVAPSPHIKLKAQPGIDPQIADLISQKKISLNQTDVSAAIKHLAGTDPVWLQTSGVSTESVINRLKESILSS